MHAVETVAKPQLPNCQSQLNDSQPVKAHGLEFSESPVVINPEAWVRSLPDWPGVITHPPRARTEKRPPMCESCLFGQHEFCECESCPCAGEFRDQPRRGKEIAGTASHAGGEI